MKVTLTNGAVQSLLKCLEAMKEEKVSLPVKAWYTLSWNRNKLVSTARASEDVRLQLVEKHGTKGEDGLKRVEQDNFPAFQKDYLELLDTETEVEIRKVSLDSLGEISDKMNAIDGIFDFFTYMVEEPQEAKEEPVVKELETVE